jgi:hypothetical protein
MRWNQMQICWKVLFLFVSFFFFSFFFLVEGVGKAVEIVAMPEALRGRIIAHESNVREALASAPPMKIDDEDEDDMDDFEYEEEEEQKITNKKT